MTLSKKYTLERFVNVLWGIKGTCKSHFGENPSTRRDEVAFIFETLKGGKAYFFPNNGTVYLSTGSSEGHAMLAVAFNEPQNYNWSPNAQERIKLEKKIMRELTYAQKWRTYVPSKSCRAIEEIDAMSEINLFEVAPKDSRTVAIVKASNENHALALANEFFQDLGTPNAELDDVTEIEQDQDQQFGVCAFFEFP